MESFSGVLTTLSHSRMYKLSVSYQEEKSQYITDVTSSINI
jgi:hypothetical protein